MRTLFMTLLLASLIGGIFTTMEDNEYDPCNGEDPTVYCGRLRVPGG